MPVPGAAIFFYGYMPVYFDESGDLGFIFSKPYRKGGSARYLTIAFLLIPKNLSHLSKRIVKTLYHRKKVSPKVELKGWQLTLDDKVFFGNEVTKLLTKNTEIKIFAITVNKRKVKPHIQQDANKLYNYMIGLILPNMIKTQSKITLIPDKRSIKVKSGNSLLDYLQIKLWFESNSRTTLEYAPMESHTAINLLFIDWIANIIWNRYEDNETRAYNILKRKVKLIHLFF